jgi:hypothetical protein
MNPLAIESALKAALAADAFPEASIYTGTSFEEMSPESESIIASVSSLQAIGVGLYTATATVKLIEPALLGADSYATFSASLETLKTALTQDYLLAHWPATDAPNFCGMWLSSISTAQESNCWTAEIQVTLGVMD